MKSSFIQEVMFNDVAFIYFHYLIQNFSIRFLLFLRYLNDTIQLNIQIQYENEMKN